jgi:hypothetical protein
VAAKVRLDPSGRYDLIAKAGEKVTLAFRSEDPSFRVVSAQYGDRILSVSGRSEVTFDVKPGAFNLFVTQISVARGDVSLGEVDAGQVRELIRSPFAELAVYRISGEDWPVG